MAVIARSLGARVRAEGVREATCRGAGSDSRSMDPSAASAAATATLWQ